MAIIYNIHVCFIVSCVWVPLGVLFKNEVSHEDMIAMSNCQQYVTCNMEEHDYIDPATNESQKVHIDQFHHILFGGDQLLLKGLLERRRKDKMKNEDWTD